MSVLNGKVEATHSKTFPTYEQASNFIKYLIEYLGRDCFEGIQVRKDGYIVNYFI